MFHVTGGLRWARNEQTFTQITQIPLAGLDLSGSGTSNEEIVTYSVSPQVNLSRDAMIYVRVASGYRPGGPNVALPGFPATVGSERVTSYEAGIKASRSEEHTSELQSLMRISYAVFCLKKKKHNNNI